MSNAVRPVQYFSDEYLERCRELSPDDIVRFLEDFRRTYGAKCGPHQRAEVAPRGSSGDGDTGPATPE